MKTIASVPRFGIRLVMLAAFFAAPSIRAAQFTVEFVAPDDEAPEYSEVNLWLFHRDETDGSMKQAAQFTSREAAFTHPFEELDPGTYMVWLFTGSFGQMNDALRPGAFTYREQIMLSEDADQALTIRYEPFDPDTVKGTETARGRVVDVDGNPVPDLDVHVVANVSVGRMTVATAHTDKDGVFEVASLAPNQQYALADATNTRLGAIRAGDDITVRLAPKVGQTAPDISFIHLESGETQRLSDFSGKVVLIDFWATWCGPCQEPMAKMQTYRDDHPEWGDRVELIALSIDDRREAVTPHLEKNGWDRSYNVWAGDGGFRAEAPQAFAVSGIPTAFLIDPDGKVVTKGHPSGMDIPALINKALAEP